MTPNQVQIDQFKVHYLLKLAQGVTESEVERMHRLRSMVEKLASDMPSLKESILETAGLGTLAIPSVYHLLHNEKPEDQQSAFHRFMQHPKLPHVLEAGGLGILAYPYVKRLITSGIGALKR